MPEYENDNPAENVDQIEYVVHSLQNQKHYNEEIYFSNTVEINQGVSSIKGPVVVEGTPEGIYELAGENVNGIYDLSSTVANTEIDANDSTPTKCFVTIYQYKANILSGIMVLLVILGVSLAFFDSKPDQTDQTSTTTTTSPTTAESTVGKIKL